MSSITFVVEFEDGQEPKLDANMMFMGGKVVSVAFRNALSDNAEHFVSFRSGSLFANGRCLICGNEHSPGIPCPFYAVKSGVIRG